MISYRNRIVSCDNASIAHAEVASYGQCPTFSNSDFGAIVHFQDFPNVKCRAAFTGNLRQRRCEGGKFAFEMAAISRFQHDIFEPRQGNTEQCFEIFIHDCLLNQLLRFHPYKLQQQFFYQTHVLSFLYRKAPSFPVVLNSKVKIFSLPG